MHVKHCLLTVLLACSALPAYAQSAPEWMSLADAWTEAVTINRVTVVYVRAPWCAPCKRLEEETFEDRYVRMRLAQLSLARLTLDEYDRTHRISKYRLSEADWATRLGAVSTPTLIFLAPDGTVLARHQGFVPPEGLATLLDAAIAETILEP